MPDLTRRDGVELIRTGSWAISTGQWDVSRGDLAAAVAARNCPAVRPPVVKIGHTDPRFTPGDGEPALGRVENLRLADGGHTLVGDFVGVPAWLDSVMASAYPDRSVEGTYNFVCQLGHTHPFALTGVALLGVTPPGVGTLRSLTDVKGLYGLAASSGGGGVQVAATVHAAADRDALKRYWLHGAGLRKWAGSAHPWTALYRELRKHMPDAMAKRVASDWYREHFGHMPNQKKASAGEDPMPNPEPSTADLVRAEWNTTAPHQQWIIEAGTDHVIVMDDTDRSLLRVPFTVDGNTVQFGPPEPVRAAYVPAAEVAAAVRFASRGESRPDDEADPQPAADSGGFSDVPAAEPEPTQPTEEDPVSDLSDIARGLGLPEDAGKDQILAAIAEQRHTPDDPTPDDEPDTDDTTGPAEPRPVPAPQPEETQPAPDPQPDRVSAAAMTEMRAEIARLSAEVAASKQEKAAQRKEAVFAAALEQGKIAPADQRSWEARYDKAPEVIAEILDSMAPGTAVPVAAAGHTGPAEPADDTDWDRLERDLYGPAATSSKGA